MPRASLDPNKAKTGGGTGPDSGSYVCTNAVIRNIPATDYQPLMPGIVLSVENLDSKGEPVRDSETQELILKFGKESAKQFNAGRGKSIEDADPEDLGKEPETEGNTLYCTDGAQLNSSCGAVVFLKTLGSLGFPQSVLDSAWMPSFVGMKFTFQSLTSKEVNAKFGTRLNEKPMTNNKGESNEVTYKVVTKWLNPTYLNGSTTASAPVQTAVVPAAHAAAHTPASAAATTTAAPAATNGALPTTVEEVVNASVAKFVAKKAGGTTDNKSQILGFLTSIFMSDYNKKTPVALKDFKAFAEVDANLVAALNKASAAPEYDDNEVWTGKVQY